MTTMRKLPVITDTASSSSPEAAKPTSYEKQTQSYSSWGGKLLQHADVLSRIQNQKEFAPITIQLAPTEACDSNCPFCSVSWRAVDKKIPWDVITKGLREFRELGAKALEITGGGNPLLYKDGTKNINDVIEFAHSLGYEIGVITNTEKLHKFIKPENAAKLAWTRISLIKLDEGVAPEEYDFTGFPISKMGFSYIIYEGTTVQSIEKIARLVELNPEIKFVRIASDCLTENSITIKRDWGDIVKALDLHSKFSSKRLAKRFIRFRAGVGLAW